MKLLPVKMPARFAASVLAALSIGVLVASCVSGPGAPDETATARDILVSAFAYAKAHHPELATYVTDNITFTLSSRTGKQRLGYTEVTYTGGPWMIRMGHPVVPDFSWDINADYNNGQIVWIGLSKNGQITEQSYVKR
jgi:hypothetical protein